MRTSLVTLLASMLLAISCAAPERPSPPDRVLFVGNSLTYVGNVPAVFSALAEANGRPMPSDMIVKGGATLSERVADGSVARALSEHRYGWLVIQERGGDLLCALGPESCKQSRHAIVELARLAKAEGTRVVMLGSYQPNPVVSRGLVDKESAAAARAGVAYVEISESLRRLRDIAPDLAWFASDGVHPGKDLVLLDAMRLHQVMRGRLPTPAPLTVRAPIYGISSGLDAVPRASDAPPPRPDTGLEVRYAAATMGTIFDAVQRAPVDGSGMPKQR